MTNNQSVNLTEIMGKYDVASVNRWWSDEHTPPQWRYSVTRGNPHITDNIGTGASVKEALDDVLAKQKKAA